MASGAEKGNFMAAVGTFDGVHRGHAFLINRLKEEAACLGLTPKLITFADHPLRVVAPERCPGLLSDPESRIGLLRDLGVDHISVLPFDVAMAGMTADRFLDFLREREGVRALAMGFNNHIGCDRRCATDLTGNGAGVDVLCLPELSDIDGVSSSAVRAALADGDADRARELLGRPYSLAGTVVGGKHLGRTIGFPTANIRPVCPEVIVPGGGVYAVDIVLPSGEIRRGMANIGTRPTVDHNPAARPSIEVNIFGFDGDLYGSAVELRFLRRLRDERKFDSLEALTAQLRLDRDAAIAAR